MTGLRASGSFVPAYYEIAMHLAKDIEQGSLRPGDLIPSESQLCHRHGVSRMTVRQGLNLLGEAGYTYSVPGKGTFVSSPQLSRASVDLRDPIRAGGRRLDPGIPLVNHVPAQPKIAAKVGVPAGSEVLELRRSWSAGGQVAAFECKYLARQTALTMHAKDLRSLPFAELVSRAIGLPFVKVSVGVSALAADGATAAFLEIEESSPVLALEETVATQSEVVLGWGHLFCRPDDYRLTAVCDPFWRRRGSNGFRTLR
jgi:GntR family transcriptional regulator